MAGNISVIKAKSGKKAAGLALHRSSKNEIYRRVELFGWEREKKPFSPSSKLTK